LSGDNGPEAIEELVKLRTRPAQSLARIVNRALASAAKIGSKPAVSTVKHTHFVIAQRHAITLPGRKKRHSA
jgi:hypothetical protein